VQKNPRDEKIILAIPLCGLLTGCPGGNREGKEIGEFKPFHVDKGRVCFSVDKRDVLNRYSLYSNYDGEKRLAVNEGLKLSYPDTCINVILDTDYRYSSSYNLNGINYHYEFFIDNNWNFP
jgi:hypothetical protein